jgi:hypothetical protein
MEELLVGHDGRSSIGEFPANDAVLDSRAWRSERQSLRSLQKICLGPAEPAKSRPVKVR